MIDVANIERAEADLNRFIERRAKQASSANAEEDLWKASARRHDARLREERLWARRDFHEQMLQSHTASFLRLIRRHKSGLRLCERELGIAATNEGDAA